MPVAGLPVDGGGVLVGGDDLLEPPHITQGQAEAVQRHGLALPVTETLSGVQTDGGDGEPVVEPARQSKYSPSRRGRRRVPGLLAAIGLGVIVRQPLSIQADQAMHSPPARPGGSGLDQMRDGQAR